LVEESYSELITKMGRDPSKYTIDGLHEVVMACLNRNKVFSISDFKKIVLGITYEGKKFNLLSGEIQKKYLEIREKMNAIEDYGDPELNKLDWMYQCYIKAHKFLINYIVDKH